MIGRIHNVASDEQGGVLVVVAVAMASIIALVMFVIETGNWFEHKRHLQLQADAAALAGGSAFKFPGCDDSQIYALTRQYAGVRDGVYAAPYNMQVGGTPDANVKILVNSTGYWSDGARDDYTDVGTPCNAKFVDVKMTELDLPWFFDLPFVPAINAHARVSLVELTELRGVAPVGVRDIAPLSGAVLFIDEEAPPASRLLGVKYLTRIGSSGGLNTWSNVDDPVPFQFPQSAKVSAVIAFSSEGPPDSPRMSISGTADEICNQPHVDCYDAPSDPVTGAVTINGGILFLHGYSSAATPGDGTPVVRDATLSSSDCPDLYGYFTYATADCHVTLTAVFDSTHPLSDVQLTAFGGGCGNNGCTMSGAGNIRTASIPITAESGLNPITVRWIARKTPDVGTPPVVCGNSFNNSNPCNGSFGVVQRAYAGTDDLSGPIRVAHLFNMDSPEYPPCPNLSYVPACNSYETKKPHRFAVEVKLAGALATSVNDPPVALRVVGGSQTGALDCDKNSNFRTELAQGCDHLFTKNKDPNLACAATNRTDQFNSPEPWDCVPIETGGDVGQFVQAMQDRVLNGSSQCPAWVGPPADPPNGRNYWNPQKLDPLSPEPHYPWGPADNGPGPEGDNRIVNVFMVPFGSFRGSGRDKPVPIVNFGTFYITGWGGSGGNADPCPGADFAPKGYLVGHFINYTVNSGQGGGSGICDLFGVNPCIAVLTK